ncbi:tetratricopeptide repeat protein [Thalassotalea insulae]|uniref:tetratricopeptide repeat protein n=1 Tax=Thalassotalea insulae TaxID=2056778 RepID=UPI0024E0EE11|nr:tetratricopeptide repeat protein [Thalassotalea insulae]
MLFCILHGSAQELVKLTDAQYEQVRSELLSRYSKVPIDAANRVDELLVEYQGRLTLRQSLRLHYTKAYFLIASEQYQLAYNELILCKTLADRLNDPSLTYYYFGYLASIQSTLENYELAVEAYLNALEFAEKAQDQAMIARTHNNIGHLLIKMKDYDKAKRYIDYFYQYGVKVDNQSYMATGLNNLGEIALAQEALKQAEEYFLQSLAIREKQNYTFNSSWSHYNLGQLYYKEKDYQKARFHLTKAIDIRKTSERHFIALMPKIALAKVHLAQQEHEKAFTLLNSVIETAERFNAYRLLAECYSLLRQYYEVQQQYQLAIAMTDKYIANQQKVVERKTSASLMHFLAELDLNAKEKENIALKKQSELATQQAKAKEQQLMLIVIAGTVIFVLVLWFLRYLAVKNRALKKVIKELNKTQQELIEADKMSALTTLVSGMAHQLNTPLGVIVTANSVMREKILNIEQQLDEKRLNLATFKQFMAEVTGVLSLSEANSDKAANLIQRFKMISAELEGAKLKEFELKLFISEKVKLIAQQYHQQLIVNITGTEVVVHNYPEVLFKVLEQLIQNTAEHTKLDTTPIYSTIDIRPQDHNVAITYQDNGEGIEEQIRERIFEPFFTTKGMQQSLGLGLNIAYNSVLHLMQGKLSCQASEQGAKFVIEIPKAIERYAS